MPNRRARRTRRTSPKRAGVIIVFMDLDAWLLAVPRRAQYLAVLLALLVCVAVGVLEDPRPYLDFSRRPILNRIHQNATYGTDTLADVYVAQVVLNPHPDAYTHAQLDLTSLRA